MLQNVYGSTELKATRVGLSGGALFLSAVNSVFQNINFCPTVLYLHKIKRASLINQ
ncbi:hypothetical protein [uncultured Psychrosphaera sp.]|uniref:hypothetical protein n=1 Tax=uncultured Psychrosphaera sp. TaxID=1403522 RepID=UPI0030F4D997